MKIEAKDIIKCVPTFNYDTVHNTLHDFSENTDQVRMSLALQKLFMLRDMDDTISRKALDIQAIQRLFPLVPKEEIIRLLNLVGNEVNRKTIVLRMLVKKEDESRKRPSPFEAWTDAQPVKKKMLDSIFDDFSSEISTVAGMYVP